MPDIYPTSPRFHALAATVALAAAVASTWPVALHLRDHVVDGARFVNPREPTNWWALNLGADVLQTVWVLGWDLHGLVTQPSHLFDANIYYPAPLSLARAEHLFATALLGAPGYLLDGPVLGHQTALVLCIVLDVWAMAYVIARWSGSAVGALIGGLLFGVSYFHRQEIFHLQSVGTPYFPLIVFALDRLGATGAARWAMVTALALALQILSGQYLGFFAMVVTLVAVATAFPVEAGGAGRLRRLGRNAGWLALSTAGAALAVLPFILPYLRLAASGGVPDNSTSLVLAFGGIRPGSWTTFAPRGAVFPPAAVLLAVAGVFALARGTRRSRVRLAVLLLSGLAGASLAGGLGGDFLHIYPVLGRILPGFNAMRVPMRWLLLPCFAVAMLAGLGAAGLARRFGLAGGLVASILAAGALAGSWPGPLPLRRMPVGAALPPAYTFLARCGGGDPLLELPAPSFLEQSHDAEPMFFSVFHWLPLVNGRASYPPESYHRAMELARRLPADDALGALRQLTAVRWLLIHCDDPGQGSTLCRGHWLRAARTRTFGTTRLVDLGPLAALPREPPRRWPVPADCDAGA